MTNQFEDGRSAAANMISGRYAATGFGQASIDLQSRLGSNRTRCLPRCPLPALSRPKSVRCNFYGKRKKRPANLHAQFACTIEKTTVIEKTATVATRFFKIPLKQVPCFGLEFHFQFRIFCAFDQVVIGVRIFENVSKPQTLFISLFPILSFVRS